MMQTNTTLTRSNLMRAGIILSVIAFPLVAYSQSGKIQPAMAATSGASSVTLAYSTSKISSANSETDAVRLHACGEQTWPDFSQDCLRGAGRGLQPRRIAMTEEAAAASAVINDPIQIAAVLPARHKASVTRRHKRVRRHAVAARHMQAREAFAEAAPD